jgi:flagella basal body P-ring formation protein FlgA
MTHPVRLVVAFVLGVAAFSALMSAARAAPALRAKVTVSREVVLLGDLISDAGALAGQPVFRAPEPGLTGSISSDAVISAADGAGLKGISTGGLKTIAVTREGRAVGASAVEGVLRLALADYAKSPAPENIDISFDKAPLLTTASTANGALAVASLTWSGDGGRFEADIVLGDPAQPQARQTVSGTATDMVDVVVPVQAIARRKTLEPADLVVLRLPRRQVPLGAFAHLDEAVGMAAKRSLRAEEPLKAGDLEKPTLVERGAVVTIVHRVPGMTLTVRGQALGSGAEGATVSVMNSQSKRTVQGTVSGANQVSVTGSQAILLSAR